MKLIFSIAWRIAKVRSMILFAIFVMILMTFASQMEIFALSLITKNVPSLGPAIGSSSFIDEITDKVKETFSLNHNFINLALFLFCIALFKAVTLFLYRYNIKIISIAVSKSLRQKYFEHIQMLPMSFYQKYNIGSLSSRIVTDANLVAEGVNSCLINYLQTPFTVISTLFLCFLTSWQLSLIMFLGFPLIIYPIIFIAQKIKKISKQILVNQENFLSVLVDFISGIQTVKAFSMEKFSLKKYAQQNEMLAQLALKSARYDVSSRPIVHAVGMAFLATALIYGIYIQHMDISEVIFFCGLLYVFYEPIKKFAEENNHIQRGCAAGERMYEILNEQPQFEDNTDASVMKGFNDSLEFENVWFKYHEEWILKDLSFTVKKGETVAIVGSTGAGKSTIAQLIPRLYDVNKGVIKIDGIPITNLTQESLRDHIAFVPQKPFLFIDTIATNIAFGKQFPQEKIEEAAHKAYVSDFIQSLPESYQTTLSEAGKNLSGGQQQRLAIARALIKGAPILILDEATSSLDMVSESYIKIAIDELKGKVTQIIIAHRLSTIEDADKIIFLDRGIKIAEGTKDELLICCPQFRLMWEIMHKPSLEEVCV